MQIDIGRMSIPITPVQTDVGLMSIHITPRNLHRPDAN
jgi:hypothetical protein